MSTTISIDTTLSDRPTLNITASSELMQNHQAALPVSPTEELAAVYDSDGLPIVLAFSPDGDFYAIVHQPGTPTGWQQIDLSAGVAPFGTAKAFSAAQLPNGNIFVALSVQSGSDPTTQDLYVAGPLSDDQTQTDWTNLAPLWVRSPNAVKGTTIDDVYIGPTDDGRNPGVPFIAVSLGGAPTGTASEYILKAAVDTGTGAVSWGWADFPTPTDLVTVLDYAVGSIADENLGNGLYILYEGQGNKLWLVFKTFVDQFGRDFVRRFTVPPGAATLQTVAGSRGTTSLFVGGTSGVWWFSPDAQGSGASGANIAPASAIPDVARGGLVVRDDQVQSGTTAVWALSGANLFYLHSNADGSWSTPVLFRQGVTRMAPLRNQQRLANELVYLGTDLDTTPAVYYMWQDPTTTLWKQDHIPIEATDTILEFDCYTTHLSVQDAAGNPASDLTFNLNADSWVSVVINGATQILDADTPVAVQPDIQGNITIINKVADLASPLLHLTGSFFTGTVDIDPAFKVFTALGQVTSATDIPVLPQTLPGGVSSGDVVSAVQNLMQFHPSAGQPQPAQEIVYRPPATAASARLNLAMPAGGTTFALSFSPAAGPTSTAALGSAANILEDLGGDILQFLDNVETDVSQFVVTVEQGVLTFTAHLGNEIATFVVNTFEEVYKTISWVFHKIGVAFKDLIQWLGMLFDWDDILTTHRVFVNLANQSFAFAQAELVTLEDKVGDFFDGLKARVQALEPLGGSTGGTNVKSGIGSVTSGVPSGAQGAFQFATASPGGNYANYHLLHGGVLNYVSAIPTIGPALVDFLNDVALPALSSVEATATQLRTDIKNALDAGTLTIDQIIEQIVGDVIGGILDALKTVVVGILKFIGDLVGLFQSALNDPVTIPFLSGLYQKFVGTPMSVLDGIMLLFAVPATVMYKLMTNEAPFGATTFGLDTGSYQQLWSTLGPQAAGDAVKGTKEVTPSLAAAAPAGSGAADSSSDSNTVTPGARIYSLIGGATALLTSTAYDVMALMGAMATVDATNEPNIDKSNALKTKVDTISKIQITLAIGNVAGSIPVVGGPEHGLQWGIWGLSFADILKSGFAVWLDDKALAQKVIGGYELAECLADVGLDIAVLAVQMNDDTNQQKSMDLLAFFPNLLASLGTGVSGATRLDTDKESQSALAIAAGGIYIIGALLDFAIIAIETEDDKAHG